LQKTGKLGKIISTEVKNMATYAKGFKKEQEHTLLLKVIVGLIILVLVVVGIAYLSDALTNLGDYDDYSDQHITTYGTILTQKDDQAVQLQNYVVYFYNADQDDCIAMQKEVLRIAAKLNKDAEVIFFVDLDAITEDTAASDAFLDAIGKTQTFLGLSPMLISVADGVFNTAYSDDATILDVLHQVEAGNYTPFE
jgi:hypothetical protein